MLKLGLLWVGKFFIYLLKNIITKWHQILLVLFTGVNGKLRLNAKNKFNSIGYLNQYDFRHVLSDVFSSQKHIYKSIRFSYPF